MGAGLKHCGTHDTFAWSGEMVPREVVGLLTGPPILSAGGWDAEGQ